jgi:Amidohydrolase
MRSVQLIIYSVVFTTLSINSSLAAPANQYQMNDFYRVEKIDAHMHLHKEKSAFVAHARKNNFKIFTINVDYPDFPSIDEQQRVAELLTRRHPRDVAYAITFPVDRLESQSWLEDTKKRIAEGINRGAVGVKIWKNIGMEARASSGSLVMIDNERFRPLFSHFATSGIPLLGHQGEPKNCWLPIDQMSVNNDKEYFKAHPQYHMYLHPEMPSYEQQMEARNRMLANQPGLQFVGMHMASLEWNVDELAKFLDQFPTAMVDVAARIGQLQYQSNLNREKVQAFFARYQDRLMYGTDLAQAPDQSDQEFIKEAQTIWLQHWRYFNTADSFKVAELDDRVRGLALPKAVIDKLYRTNVQRLYPRAWHSTSKGLAHE